MAEQLVTRTSIAISCVLVLLLAACSHSASHTPTPSTVTASSVAQSTPTAATAIASATPSPTSLPPETPTSVPTITPAPTPTPTPTQMPIPTTTLVGTNRPPDQVVDLPNVDTHYTLNVTSLDLNSGVVMIDERVDISSRQGWIQRLFFTVTTAQWGYFHLTAASVDGVPQTPTSLNDDFTLALDPPAGEHWTVGFEFELDLTQVPEDWYGSGMDGNIMRLGYWFPILSTNFPYPSTADPAYTRVATFDVSLPLPNDVPFVSTGTEVNSIAIDAEHTRHELHADKVRDFALTIVPDGRIDTVETSNGVTIRLLSNPTTTSKQRSTELAAARTTIETLSSLIGPYPYPVFSMANAGPSLPGGIEFPMFIDLNPNIGSTSRLVYHETAHQWLYGIIGTRPQQDIWIDEGGAQFLEGYLDSGTPLPTVPNGGYGFPLDSNDDELPQGSGIPGYQSIYEQGQRFYNAVMDTMGEDAFWGAMQQLYQDFEYGVVTPWDVLVTWQEHSAVDLRPLFKATFRYAWIDRLPEPGG